MKMFGPEFQRYLWLEFSPVRLLTVPAFLGIVFLVAIGDNAEIDDVYVCAALLYFGIVILLGSMNAGTAMRGEFMNNTWDFQRMSAIEPMELSFGKLFGSTSFIWYAGLPVSLALVASGELLTHREVTYPPIVTLALLVLSGLFAQATAFLAGLVMGQRSGWSSVLAGILGGFAVLTISFPQFFGKSGWVGESVWHGVPVSTAWLIVGTVGFFWFWILVGIYRMMRLYLQFRATPFVWLAFAVSFITLLTGMLGDATQIEPDMLATSRLVLAFGISYAFFYGSMLLGVGDIVVYRRLLEALKARSWRRSAENLPLWTVNFLLVLVFLVWALANLGDVGPDGRFPSPHTLLIGLVLMAVRDFIVMSAVMGSGSRHRIYFALLYYVMAYILLPIAVLRVKAADGLMPFLFPVGTQADVVNLSPLVLEVFVAAWAASLLWRSRWGTLGTRIGDTKK